MKARPLAFLMLALALVLAPMGLCLSHAAAAAGHVQGPAMQHGDPQASVDHSSHGDSDKGHYCAECRPDSFVKAGKAAPADVAPTGLAAPLMVSAPVPAFALQTSKATFARGISPPPPPRSRTYRARLQI